MTNLGSLLLSNQSVIYPGWTLPTTSTMASTKSTKPHVTTTRMTEKYSAEESGVPTTTEQTSDVWVLDLTWDDGEYLCINNV